MKYKTMRDFYLPKTLTKETYLRVYELILEEIAFVLKSKCHLSQCGRIQCCPEYHKDCKKRLSTKTAMFWELALLLSIDGTGFERIENIADNNTSHKNMYKEYMIKLDLFHRLFNYGSLKEPYISYVLEDVSNTTAINKMTASNAMMIDNRWPTVVSRRRTCSR